MQTHSRRRGPTNRGTGCCAVYSVAATLLVPNRLDDQIQVAQHGRLGVRRRRAGGRRTGALDLPDLDTQPGCQWAASNASWIAFEIRPREETSYPAAFAHSRIARTWSRLDGTGAVLADVAALPLGPRLAGADVAAVFTGEAAATNRASLPAIALRLKRTDRSRSWSRQVLARRSRRPPGTHQDHQPGRYG